MAISQCWASSLTPESPFLELAKVRNFHQSSLHCSTSSSPGHWNSGGTSTFSDMRRQASRPGSLMIKWSLKAHSCQHSYDIAVDQASHLLVGNAGNSSCSVSSNSRQRFQLLGRSRHLAFQLLSNRYCCLSKPAAPGQERPSQSRIILIQLGWGCQQNRSPNGEPCGNQDQVFTDYLC